MNSYERLMSRLRGESVDRPPNLSILMRFAAQYAGVSYRNFSLDSRAQFDANIKCHQELGIDSVTVMSDPYAEAEDYGMSVEHPENCSPRVLRLFWPKGGKVPSPCDISLRGIEETVRMKNRIATIDMYASTLKGRCPIIGWVEGAIAEYCNLRGVNAVMLDLADEADYLHPVLDTLCDQAIIYAVAQIRAGADIIGIGDAACSIIGPKLYRKYGKPYEQKLVDAIRREGAKSKLHICGDITPLLPDINKIQPDIVDIDWMVDWATACKQLQSISASGNLDPVGIIMQSSPEGIRGAVNACLDIENERSIISSGCEVPPDTRVENLLSIGSALKTIANVNLKTVIDLPLHSGDCQCKQLNPIDGQVLCPHGNDDSI